MFRWASIIGSSIAVALLGATSVIGFIAAASECVGVVWDGPLPSRCFTLGSLAVWPFFLGVGLTALVALAHLSVAVRQSRWGWFNALLIAPPSCYFMSAYVAGPSSSNGFILFILCIPFIGLPNLLFSLEVLKPVQKAVQVSPSGKELSATFRWASTVCSSIAVALLGGMSVIGSFEEVSGCAGADSIDPLPSVCSTLYTLIIWTFFIGVGLIALFGLIHLGIASQQHRWGWFNALLMVPLLCFFMGPYLGTITYTGTIIYNAGLVLSIVSLPLAGMPNLLFSIKVVKPLQ